MHHKEQAMIYNTSYFFDGWNRVNGVYTRVDIFFTVGVQDGSFSHDWTPGAVEKVTDYEIESISCHFLHNGMPVEFDPTGGHTCIIEWYEGDYEAAKQAAIVEAINAFENPEGTWEDDF